MLGVTTAKKLDLSKLTDEEASHVWQVVQRDFHLRKKEEDRLGDLKTKIKREDSKKEFLGHQTWLTESYCIRCLKPFKFLVNSKRQCLDCQLYVCKACSRYNMRQHGFVCDPCHMTRVLKIGTLEWYHENVRSRFKRFGSAKVMRSLFKRLTGKHTYSSDDDDDDDEQPGFENSRMDATDSHHYNQMKKTKRRLTVDPVDFHLASDINSRRQTHQTRGSQDMMMINVGERESMLAEADMASGFHHDLKEQSKSLDFNVDVGCDHGLTPQQDDAVYSDHPTVPSRSMSRLSYSSCGSGSAGGPWGPTCYALGPDDSEEDPVFKSHFNHISQESLNYPNSPPQIVDLDRRMSAIETLLNHLQITLTSNQTNKSPQIPDKASPPHGWEEVDIEEHQLRQKLNEMAGDISDHSLSSDEEEASNLSVSLQEMAAAVAAIQDGDKTLTRTPSRPTSRALTAVPRLTELNPQPSNSDKRNSSIESMDNRYHLHEEESGFKGSTALLFELEDKIAQAAADVQNTQTQVSYIENRIAALNTAGMPVEKRLKSGIMNQTRRLSQNFPPKSSQETGFIRRRLSLK
uniref:melanophilin n=1 Tax=Doryrhamphus excisus TaxID=161450 RepID=UPI0025AE63B4|nr:melanophilin [Doryrhamphus excisus]